MLFLDRSVLLVLVGATLVLGSAGCGDDSPPASSTTVQQKKGKKGKKGKKAKAADTSTETIPVAPSDSLAYSYNPIGKRDPFRSFVSEEVLAQEQRIETPLQKYEIDQYKLVAIIQGMDEPVAMVEDPPGDGHLLRRDVLIGKNWGKVVRITNNEVIVAEEYRDPEGKLIVNEIPLKLEEEGGSGKK